jgi:hypothetical protein
VVPLPSARCTTKIGALGRTLTLGVERRDGRVVPVGDLPEEDPRDDGAGELQPACGRPHEVVGDGFGAEVDGDLDGGASMGGCLLGGGHAARRRRRSLTCLAVKAAMPALLPTDGVADRATPGFCCWYLANARVEEGRVERWSPSR